MKFDKTKIIMLLLLYVVLKGGIGGGSAPGPRQMMIVYETSASTPAISNEILKLQAGAQSKYLADKQHTLKAIDADKPDPMLPKFAPYQGAEVLVIAPPDKLLVREKFTTADSAIELLKRNGG